MNKSNLSDDALAELLTLTVEVNDYGTTYYRNHLGHCHRIHGPAVITSCGTRYWYLDGKRHRVHGPAMEHPEGLKRWYLDGWRFSEREYNERVKSI